jgi:hypothetical protein
MTRHKALRGRKYLSLETYRRDGRGVRTPVWFAEHDDEYYVYTTEDAGKVKRLRREPRCRVAPCDWRGRVEGEWLDATARIVGEEEAALGQRLLREKYWPWKSIGDVVSRLRGVRHAVLAIRLASG